MHRKKEFDATPDLGIPVTLLDTVLENEDGSVEIPNLDMLLASVAVARVLEPIQLIGVELRFLRHVLHLTGAEFATEIDLSDKTVVSRWENDKTRPGGYTEKIIRQHILNELSPRALGIDIGQTSIPRMKIQPHAISEGPLPMSFRLEKRPGSENQPIDCYAAAA